MSNAFVVAMGIGTVFIGLICIVVILKIMSLLCGAVKENPVSEKVEQQHIAEPAVIENRQEIIAAVSAAVAEELGEDISAIRILSFKKI